MKDSGEEMLNLRCSRSVSSRSKSLSAFSTLGGGLVVLVPFVVTDTLTTFCTLVAGLLCGEGFSLGNFSFSFLTPSWSRGFRGNLFTAACEEQKLFVVLLYWKFTNNIFYEAPPPPTCQYIHGSYHNIPKIHYQVGVKWDQNCTLGLRSHDTIVPSVKHKFKPRRHRTPG